MPATADGRASVWLPGVRPLLADGLAIGAVLALGAMLGGRYLASAFESWIPGGWDGVAHYAIADLYSRNVFPAVSGWLPEYFAGMPFPDFYPPIFYFSVALISRAGLSTAHAFLLLQTLASAAVPVLCYLCTRRLCRDRVAAFVAGALAAAFMAGTHPVAIFGITLKATFGQGLATQLLGFCWVLAFYFFLLGAHRSRRDAALAALCLAAVPLTNVHVVWVAAALYAGLVGARLLEARGLHQRRRCLARHGAVGIAALLLCACWVLPMLARLDYVPTLAMEPPPAAAIAHAFFRHGIYGLLAAAVAWSNRDREVLALVASLGVLLTFGLLPVARLVPDLALQPGRFVIAFLFLVTPLVGYLVVSLAARLPWRKRRSRPLLALLAVGIFVAHVDPVRGTPGSVGPRQAARYQAALETLSQRRDGRVLVELGGQALSDAFALQSLVGRAGNLSLTTVFRESAISVFFAAPLRNGYSRQREAFGVDGKMADPGEQARQPWRRRRARLRTFNVRYLALQSRPAKAAVERLPEMRRLTPWAGWTVYQHTAEHGFAEVPRREPVLTFAEWSVKRRPDLGFDFLRLAEERFAAGEIEPLLTLARDPTLDTSQDWSRFRAALITSYRYRDADAAFERVASYSRRHPVVLLESDDPLYARLAATAPERPLLRPVPRATASQALALLAARPHRTAPTPPWRVERAFVTATVERLSAALAQLVPPLAATARVAAVELDGERTTVTLDRRPEEPVPIWVKQSYLPNWVDRDGGDVYLAFPTFQLAFARQRELELRFAPHAASRWGWALSLVGLVCVLALGWRDLEL